MKNVHTLESFLNESNAKIDDTDYLFRLFYYCNSADPKHRKLIYDINDMVGEDTGNMLNDWERSSAQTKTQIIGMIKEYILTLS